MVEVKDFHEARKPAWILKIDFGDVVGIKQSSAQIKDLFKAADLLGKQVICVLISRLNKLATFNQNAWYVDYTGRMTLWCWLFPTGMFIMVPDWDKSSSPVVNGFCIFMCEIS